MLVKKQTRKEKAIHEAMFHVVNRKSLTLKYDSCNLTTEEVLHQLNNKFVDNVINKHIIVRQPVRISKEKTFCVYAHIELVKPLLIENRDLCLVEGEKVIFGNHLTGGKTLVIDVLLNTFQKVIDGEYNGVDSLWAMTNNDKGILGFLARHERPKDAFKLLKGFDIKKPEQKKKFFDALRMITKIHLEEEKKKHPYQ